MASMATAVATAGRPSCSTRARRVGLRSRARRTAAAASPLATASPLRSPRRCGLTERAGGRIVGAHDRPSGSKEGVRVANEDGLGAFACARDPVEHRAHLGHAPIRAGGVHDEEPQLDQGRPPGSREPEPVRGVHTAHRPLRHRVEEGHRGLRAQVGDLDGHRDVELEQGRVARQVLGQRLATPGARRGVHPRVGARRFPRHEDIAPPDLQQRRAALEVDGVLRVEGVGAREHRPNRRHREHRTRRRRPAALHHLAQKGHPRRVEGRPRQRHRHGSRRLVRAEVRTGHQRPHPVRVRLARDVAAYRLGLARRERGTRVGRGAEPRDRRQRRQGSPHLLPTSGGSLVRGLLRVALLRVALLRLGSLFGVVVVIVVVILR